MAGAFSIDGAGHTRSSRGRIVQFPGIGRVRVGPTSCDYQRAVGKQRRRVQQPLTNEAAVDRPRSRGRIVNFRAWGSGVRKSLRTSCCTTYDEQPAIGEQRRRVIIPGSMQATGKLPLKGSGSGSARLLQQRRT